MFPLGISQHVPQETAEENDLLGKVPACEGPSPFMANKRLCQGGGKRLDRTKTAIPTCCQQPALGTTGKGQGENLDASSSA